MELTFFGAAQTVTGSKYLLNEGKDQVLVDCGLFQGYKPLRLRNWKSLPVPAKKIQAILLTHAHIDHSGYIPRFMKEGFHGPIYATSGTRDLCEILLTDSGRIHEEDAWRANKYHYTKHHPALPLYTEYDAKEAMKLFRTIKWEKEIDIGNGFYGTWHEAGHILGASFLVCRNKKTSILFSGDLGRFNDPLMHAPHHIVDADYMVIESTYGSRRHGIEDPQEYLANVINETAKRGGTILIPSFAVGRAQGLLYYLYLLKQQKRIPDLPVYLDSPMAIDATDLLHTHIQSHKLTAQQCREVCQEVHYTQTPQESKKIDANPMPKIVIAASGMLEGGRILHHLKVYGLDHRSTVLFTGYQAGGTRGADLLSGRHEIKIHGQFYHLKAELKELPNISAHADYEEMLHWLEGVQVAPKRVFITHGEVEAAEHLAKLIDDKFGWQCIVPDYKDKVKLR